MSSIASVLTGAKEALSKANKFTTSVEGKTPSEFAKKPTPKPTPKPKSEPRSEGEDVAAGLHAIQENIKQYQDAVPKYHKGGKIKKDGEQVINAEKGETVLPNHDPKRVSELAMEHLKGMAAGLTKKEEKKPAHKKHGKVKVMHVHRADDDTYIIHHEHEPNEDGTVNPNSQHTAQTMDDLHDHLEEHMGEPAQGEAEADAGMHGVPDDMAQKAGMPVQGA